VIYGAILVILGEHVLLLLFERLPWQLVLLGMGSHVCYFQLLKSFPFLQLTAPAFLLSCVAACGCTYGWVRHFASDYHSPAYAQLATRSRRRRLAPPLAPRRAAPCPACLPLCAAHVWAPSLRVRQSW
jgi:hypothetical protein